MGLMRWILAIFSLFLLAACGAGAAEEPTATLRPTSTTTPISTALPDVATPMPAGVDAENPVRLVMASDQSQSVANALAAQYSEAAGITVAVTFVETQAQALSALCNSTPNDATFVWLRDFAVGTAALEDCGVPRVQITREVGRDSITGENGVLLTNFELDLEESEQATAQLADKTFCRISLDDLYSWTVPTLLLQANGVQMSDFDDINEVADNDALLAGLQDESCDAIGLTTLAWEEATDEDDTLGAVADITATSPDFPYGVLYFSYDVSLEVIDILTEATFTLETASISVEATPEATPETEAEEADSDDTDAEATPEADGELALSDIFGEGQLIEAEAEDFYELAAFLEATGLDFTMVGN